MGEARRTCTPFTFRDSINAHPPLQLFLEEERERELETLYESGIAESLNRIDAPIGSGVNGGNGDVITHAEVTTVTKQTTETLMAGERIMEAIDLADNERAVFQAYHDDMSRLSKDDAMRLQAPPRNPVLAAYDMEPYEYVLRVVEKVQSTALQDALLVLPFGKVVSLMIYLNMWAQKVISRSTLITLRSLSSVSSGLEYSACLAHHIFSPQNTSPSDCC